jgi:hypothetical protein
MSGMGIFCGFIGGGWGGGQPKVTLAEDAADGCSVGETSHCQQVKKRKKVHRLHRLRHTAAQIKGNFGTKIRVICNAIWRNLWTKIFNLLTGGDFLIFILLRKKRYASKSPEAVSRGNTYPSACSRPIVPPSG